MDPWKRMDHLRKLIAATEAACAHGQLSDVSRDDLIAAHRDELRALFAKVNAPCAACGSRRYVELEGRDVPCLECNPFGATERPAP